MISTAEFEQLFFEYQPRLVRFAVRFVDEETAEDMVQNCFLKLWEKRESMALTNAQALLFQMVHNECLNELKHRVVAGTESLDALMEVEGYLCFSSDRRLISKLSMYATATPTTKATRFLLSRRSLFL